MFYSVKTLVLLLLNLFLRISDLFNTVMNVSFSYYHIQISCHYYTVDFASVCRKKIDVIMQNNLTPPKHTKSPHLLDSVPMLFYPSC